MSYIANTKKTRESEKCWRKMQTEINYPFRALSILKIFQTRKMERSMSINPSNMTQIISMISQLKVYLLAIWEITFVL